MSQMDDQKKLMEFTRKLHELMVEYNVSIGAEVEGDTHGIDESFVIETYKEQLVVNSHCGYIDHSDLKRFLESK